MPDLDRDRILALSYIAPKQRSAVEALWQLDVTLGAVLAGGREPLISQIKLTWWREALEKLDSAPPPAEPALQSAAEQLLPRGLTGTELSAMEEGWAALLAPDLLSEEDLQAYASNRGGRLFAFTARLLGGEADEAVERGGEAWALLDLARHSANRVDADAAIAAARARLGHHGRRWPARLRPLGMLAALAGRDAEPGRVQWEEHGAPRRMLRMLRHRLTGF